MTATSSPRPSISASTAELAATAAEPAVVVPTTPGFAGRGTIAVRDVRQRVALRVALRAKVVRADEPAVRTRLVPGAAHPAQQGRGLELELVGAFRDHLDVCCRRRVV